MDAERNRRPLSLALPREHQNSLAGGRMDGRADEQKVQHWALSSLCLRYGDSAVGFGERGVGRDGVSRVLSIDRIPK